MADIAYTRAFKHDPDYIDNETVVEAGGPNGFNTKFHALEAEFDRLAAVVAAVNAALNKVPQPRFVTSQSPVVLDSSGTSEQFAVESYVRQPSEPDRVYFAAVTPQSGPTPVPHVFHFRSAAGNRVNVTVQFYNPWPDPVRFGFRVMTLSEQA